jgi:hypothetical protein
MNCVYDRVWNSAARSGAIQAQIRAIEEHPRGNARAGDPVVLLREQLVATGVSSWMVEACSVGTRRLLHRDERNPTRSVVGKDFLPTDRCAAQFPTGVPTFKKLAG